VDVEAIEATANIEAATRVEAIEAKRIEAPSLRVGIHRHYEVMSDQC